MKPRALPRRGALVVLLALACAPPLLLQAFGDGPGSFAMFTRPERYRLRVLSTRADRSRVYVPLARLAPHLGKDARRIIIEAEDWYVGETHVALLASGLGDLGRLVCQLEQDALTVDVVLERASILHEPKPTQVEQVSCGAARG
jgi:hypothetical protein